MTLYSPFFVFVCEAESCLARLAWFGRCIDLEVKRDGDWRKHTSLTMHDYTAVNGSLAPDEVVLQDFLLNGVQLTRLMDAVCATGFLTRTAQRIYLDRYICAYVGKVKADVFS